MLNQEGRCIGSGSGRIQRNEDEETLAKTAKIAKEDKQSSILLKPIYFSGFAILAIFARASYGLGALVEILL